MNDLKCFLCARGRGELWGGKSHGELFTEGKKLKKIWGWSGEIREKMRI